MDNNQDFQEEPKTEEVQTAAPAQAPQSNTGLVVGLVAGLILFIAFIVVSVLFLLQDGGRTETIRDIFIIFMALEFLVIGLALVIMIIQLASLINLLQNEVTPILESTNETANTLRGTTKFLSENLTEPVIKLNSYLAGFRRLLKFDE